MIFNEVIVVGGGPAGITTALSLQKMGVNCLVIDNSSCLDVKPGESIHPNARSIFKKVGIASFLTNQLHLPCYGSRFLWGHNEIIDDLFIYSNSSHGWHLDRRHFELQLKSFATGNQVVLQYNTSVLSVKYKNAGWEILTKDENNKLVYRKCNFLVDATGRSSKIARSLGVKKVNTDLLVAAWLILQLHERRFPNYTFVESIENGWWYAAPLSNERLAVSFFSDSDLFNTDMLNIEAFLKNVQRTKLINSAIADLKLNINYKPKVYPASSSYLQKRFGDNWLAVGDAAFSYDPISSYGVVSALESGYYAGHAIFDYFNGENEAMQAYDYLISTSFEIYRTKYLQQYEQENRWKDSLFWKRRCKLP